MLNMAGNFKKFNFEDAKVAGKLIKVTYYAGKSVVSEMGPELNGYE